MFRRAALALIACLAFAASLSAQTIDDIVAKNIAARGGLEKLKAVKSMKITGKTTIGPGMEAPLVIETKRPNKVRLDIVVQGMTLSQAYDGKQGWLLNPFGGGQNAEPMSPEDLRDAEEQADMDGPLVDWKAKGHKVELVGKEKVEGTDTYKIKVQLKNGNTRYFYLDANSYLDIKTEGKRTVRGTERESEQSIGDYRDVRGLMIPHSMEGGIKGQPQKQKITIEKIELDVPIDDSRFAMPAKKDEPAEKKPPEKK
jgi:outer membrane lipoprotein-sorting protein